MLIQSPWQSNNKTVTVFPLPSLIILDGNFCKKFQKRTAPRKETPSFFQLFAIRLAEKY